MPIRFRCVYCDKLLGIARRKAGAVVNCPQCSEKLIVPTPEPENEAERHTVDTRATEDEDAFAEAAVVAPVRLFEQSNLDALFQSKPTFRSEPETKGSTSPDMPLDYVPAASQAKPEKPPPKNANVLTAPLPFLKAEEPRPPGYFLSTAKASWLSVVFVILLALAFGGGMIVGRMLK